MDAQAGWERYTFPNRPVCFCAGDISGQAGTKTPGLLAEESRGLFADLGSDETV